MYFTYSDLKFYLEERELCPQEYFLIAENSAVNGHAYMAHWLGYDSVDSFEDFAVEIEYIRDGDDSYYRTHVDNAPSALDREIYDDFLKTCADTANWVY